MQRLRELARAVETVFEELQNTFSDFQRNSNLACRSGCGNCCNNPQIETSILEMLPLAINFFDQGRAEQVLMDLNRYNGTACFHYTRHSLDGSQGECSVYKQRPAICRMFGVAGASSKSGAARLSVCRIIKLEHPEAYQHALIVSDSIPPPRFTDGKARVRLLDYDLGKSDLPINLALKAALEKVLFTASYSVADECVA